MVRLCVRSGVVAAVLAAALAGVPGCSSGGGPPSDEEPNEALQESAEQAAPPGMGDALQQMYEGGEVDEATAEKLFQSGAMMPQGYPTQKAQQQR